jgi:iron complex transport system ATP-binding protein
MTAILQAQSASFQIRRHRLVEATSLDLQAGQVTIVVGPNGAGKSTLLKLLAGEHRPSAGRVLLNGEALHGTKPWRLACARAVLPQGAQLFLPFTVHQAAALGGEGIGRSQPRAARDAATEAALMRAGAAHLAERMFHTLSGGEQQRVHFARVLCQLAAGRSIESRQVLLLDEPIASLDLKHQIALLQALRDLAAEGTAVFAIIHDLNLAAAFADVLVVLDKGRIVARGHPQDVLTDRLLWDVFGLDLQVGQVPEGNLPFVLPRRAAKEAATQR